MREDSIQMDEQSLLALAQNAGYRLLDRPHHESPGHAALLVVIREKPTDKYFDPETMHLHSVDRTSTARGLTLCWTVPQPDTDRICPGRVILTDRSDERVEFFTFGGSLTMIERPDRVIYVHHSPAPILELIAEEESVADQLAFETESLIGEAAATWGHDEPGFQRRMATVDPLSFYLAALKSILFRYESVRALEESYPELIAALHREKRWYATQDLWPHEAPTLENLLSPA